MTDFIEVHTNGIPNLESTRRRRGTGEAWAVGKLL